MKLKINISIYLLLLACSCTYGQVDQYKYKRELKGITNQWHKLTLPNGVFSKTQSDLSDIRIFGVLPNNDTVEAPYILQQLTDEISSKEVIFTLINQSRNDKGYYFTFEIPARNQINKISLDFKQQNFDWQIELEGSHNQQEWFTILDNYRILSINNSLSNYQFTKLSFPNSKYRYYRLLVRSDVKPKLITAKISLYKIKVANYKIHPISKISVNEDKKAKQTIIDIYLEMPVSVSYLNIDIGNKFDYYRPITVKYLSDSSKAEQGWRYHYSTLTSGTLSSIEKNGFKFRSTILQKLKIIIHNHDNEPLKVDSATLRGYNYELIARFNDKGNYYLVYGNENASWPQYDINRFTNKIPEILTGLKLGKEQLIENEEIRTSEPLFNNKVWLWIIMTVIILLLGWFSIRMLQNK